jgi:hypothetical protein
METVVAIVVEAGVPPPPSADQMKENGNSSSLTTVTAVVEVIEQDTVDDEDISNALQFVLPDLATQQSASSLGISINNKVFAGWVRQPSPCCGAASVAGAWNALFGLHRPSPHAMNHVNIIEAYCSLFTSKLHSQLTSFERKLGAPIQDVLLQINVRLKAVGRDFAGKKKCAATKKTVFEALVSLVKANPRTAPAEALTPTNGNDVPPTTVSSIDCFRDLLELDGVDLVGPEDQTMSAKVIPEPDPNDEEKSEVINIILHRISRKCLITNDLYRIASLNRRLSSRKRQRPIHGTGKKI